MNFLWQNRPDSYIKNRAEGLTSSFPAMAGEPLRQLDGLDDVAQLVKETTPVGGSEMDGL